MRVGTRFHSEDAGDYCSAASAMLLLAHLNDPDWTTPTFQSLLYSAAEKFPNSTGVTPKGMRDMLNGRLAALGSLRYDLKYFGRDEKEDVIRWIVARLESTQAPCFVLGYGQHWALVDGYELDSYGDIETFLIHNPQTDNTEPPPRHLRGDVCGSARWKNQDIESVDPVNGHFLEPVPELKKQFVVVAANGAEAAGGVRSIGGRDGQRRWLEWFREFSDKSSLGREYPVAVEATDDDHAFLDAYALREVLDEDGKVAGFLRLQEGRIVGSLSFGPGGVTIPSDTEVAQAARHVPWAAGDPELGEFVWRLTDASTTPYLPFRRIRYGGSSGMGYARLDGEQFASIPWRLTVG